MDLRFEHKEAMKMIGFSAKINPIQSHVLCPQFWEKEYNQRFEHLWKTGVPENGEELAVLENKIGMFAMCIMNDDDSFEYAITGIYKGGRVPWGMKLFDLPESDYAVFSCKGALPDSLQKLSTDIWINWYPTEGYKYRANTRITLEYYTEGDMKSPDYECGIWIPVERTE